MLGIVGLVSVFFLSGFAFGEDKVLMFDGYTEPSNGEFVEMKLQENHMTSVPVMVGGEPDLDACGAVGAIQGINRNGDGFVAVRSGPGSEHKMIDKFYHNGDMVSMCDSKGKWIGVVYGKNCGVGTPILRRKPYDGSCKSGWVYGKYVRLVAG